VVGLSAHWLGFGTRLAELKHSLATHISSLSRGLSSKITFDEISAQNLSMSFPELIKFTNMMFKDVSFTRNEMRWFMMQAKSKPISSIEGNWHGDSEGDIKLLNYVEWLGCLLRMALVGYGTLGLSPDEAVGRLAETMDLYNVLELQDRLYRIARTNGGFGAWCDPNTPFEEGNPLALAVKRPKGLDDFMLPRTEMLRLQDRLMRLERTDKNRIWVPFDGPYISISVPLKQNKPHKPHLFVVEVQNTSAEPRDLSFRSRNLPWLRAQYTPCKAAILSAGMKCRFELAAYINEPGDYSGEVHFTDKDGNGTFAICPIYIRALKESAIGRSQALTARESNPVIYEDGTLGQRVNSPAETDPLSPLIRKTMAMLPPKPNTMDWNKKQNVSFPGVVCLHTCSRCTMLPGCMHACVRSVRMRKCSTPSSIPMCVRALPHAPSCTAGGRRKGSFHTSHCPTSSLVILSVYFRPLTSLCPYISFPRLFICTSRVRTCRCIP
jgi:hypothetical protein